MLAPAEMFVPPAIMDSVAGKAAKRNVLRLASRYSATSGSYRCTACGSRCSVQVEYDEAGAIVHSKGQCRTPSCIAWED